MAFCVNCGVNGAVGAGRTVKPYVALLLTPLLSSVNATVYFPGIVLGEVRMRNDKSF
jgi:hypothetical protein